MHTYEYLPTTYLPTQGLTVAHSKALIPPYQPTYLPTYRPSLLLLLLPTLPTYLPTYRPSLLLLLLLAILLGLFASLSLPLLVHFMFLNRLLPGQGSQVLSLHVREHLEVGR